MSGNGFAGRLTTRGWASVAIAGFLISSVIQPAARAQAWEPVPIVTPAARSAGAVPGGEGGQWFRDIAISAADPSFLVFATDVGGVYRSTDGGGCWEPCNVGFDARGAIAVAIDPRNADRVIALAGNSTDWNSQWGPSVHGLYLSDNRAASWKQVLPRNEGVGAAFEGTGAVAFDSSSFDATLGRCQRAYFAPRDGGLFRSDDGGASWTAVQPGGFGNARLKVDGDGRVYLAGSASVDTGRTRGVFRSEDHGESFVRIFDEPVDGLDVERGAVYISGSFGARVSRDAGKTFGPPLALKGLDRQNDKPVLNITVSPADPRRMAAWICGDDWKWVRYMSSDAGTSWAASTWDNTLATLPFNVRQGHWAFHPTEVQKVFSIGGDWITRSTDGGKTFRHASNGYNGVMVGRSFNFSATSPNALALFFQDYSGAVTRDGGKSWRQLDVSGKGWGGYCYGGFTADGTTIFGGDAESWGGPRRLRVSHDGGKTWANATDAAGAPLVFAGPDVSFADPRNPRTLFASNFRSADKGRAWTAMPDCDGVFTASAGKEAALFGVKGNHVVQSDDGGRTWKSITADAAGPIVDVAFDHERGRLYAAFAGRLHAWTGHRWETLDTPGDQRDGRHVISVAVDPVDPGIVYAAGSANIYKSSASVIRSTDAGATWTTLTRSVPLDAIGQDGANEAQWVRVHPRTREAWVSGQCFGMWKIAAPK